MATGGAAEGLRWLGWVDCAASEGPRWFWAASGGLAPLSRLLWPQEYSLGQHFWCSGEQGGKDRRGCERRGGGRQLAGMCGVRGLRRSPMVLGGLRWSGAALSAAPLPAVHKPLTGPQWMCHPRLERTWKSKSFLQKRGNASKTVQKHSKVLDSPFWSAPLSRLLPGLPTLRKPLTGHHWDRELRRAGEGWGGRGRRYGSPQVGWGVWTARSPKPPLSLDAFTLESPVKIELNGLCGFGVGLHRNHPFFVLDWNSLFFSSLCYASFNYLNFSLEHFLFSRT